MMSQFSTDIGQLLVHLCGGISLIVDKDIPSFYNAVRVLFQLAKFLLGIREHYLLLLEYDDISVLVVVNRSVLHFSFLERRSACVDIRKSTKVNVNITL